jgi:glycosyltransferase involved in cell wall biosynthesis
MNPWTAVAARLLGYRDVSTVGLYAVEGGRSWRLLRRVLGSGPVVTLSEHEAMTWRTAGGRALSVRYGSTFAEPSVPHRPEAEGQENSTVTIFVGGTSDRDEEAIAKLVAQVEASEDLRLVIAVGGSLQLDTGRVRRVPSVTAAQFSALLAGCDVVFLPLTDNGRAAGHMVLVEALQRGKPVVATWVAGMDEYFDGEYIRAAQEDPISQLRTVGRAFGSRTPDVQAYWRRDYSKEAFGARVLNALEQLSGKDPL